MYTMVTGIQKSTASYCTRFIFNLIHAWQCAQFWVHQTELQLFTEDRYPPKTVALLHHISRWPGVAGASGSAACATWVTTWWGARGRGSRGDRWPVQGRVQGMRNHWSTGARAPDRCPWVVPLDPNKMAPFNCPPLRSVLQQCQSGSTHNVRFEKL